VSALPRLATRALRTLDPEDAHGLAIQALKLGLGPAGGPDDPILATSLAGLPLPNAVGLAPGFDKDAEVFGPMLRAGFGFVECGTVTPKPQAGNPRPRLFRLSEDRAVINRMGFNNRGVEAFAGRLAARGPGVVGANIGANKDSEDRIGDYVAGLRRLWGLASYFTINVSSPNTPGLRALQTRAALEELLGRAGPGIRRGREHRRDLPGPRPGGDHGLQHDGLAARAQVTVRWRGRRTFRRAADGAVHAHAGRLRAGFGGAARARGRRRDRIGRRRLCEDPGRRGGRAALFRPGV
jgi:hypothetical protein